MARFRDLPLSQKILCLALLNISLLAAMLLAFARSQFQLGPESLLPGPARDRILAIANAFSLEFESTPAASRTEWRPTGRTNRPSSTPASGTLRP